MSRTFSAAHHHHLNLHPQIENDLPVNALTRLVVEFIAQLDLSAIYDQYGTRGGKSIAPEILLGLLLYGYVMGITSSRKIEQATYDNAPMKYIAGGLHPDHDTIAQFRKRFLPEIQALFAQFLLLAQQAGVLPVEVCEQTDLVVTTTGYSRKAKECKTVNQEEAVAALMTIWEVCGRIGSRRLKPFLPEIIGVLERHQELILTPEAKTLLLNMSQATIDRRLKGSRSMEKDRLSSTKPGSLSNGIMSHNQPGFVEVDLIAHCGNTNEGYYLNTLIFTDIATGWTELLVLPNQTEAAVYQAITDLRQRLPFPLLGIASDNSNDSVNEAIDRYCQTEEIPFTCSLSCKKNGSALVKRKNWSVVRHIIGYARLTKQELDVLVNIYADLRLYINFFQPVMKLVGKQIMESKTVKQYDEAVTPYRRVLASGQLPIKEKVRLINQYMPLNPVALRRCIDQNVARLLSVGKDLL